MVTAVNTVLSSARTEAKGAKKDSVPSTLSAEDVVELRIIKKLLKPFAVLTDKLQGDYVTSPLVILGCIHALTGDL